MPSSCASGSRRKRRRESATTPPKPELAAEDELIATMTLGLSIDSVRVVRAEELFN
jgi:hypothetical protein